MLYDDLPSPKKGESDKASGQRVVAGVSAPPPQLQRTPSFRSAHGDGPSRPSALASAVQKSSEEADAVSRSASVPTPGLTGAVSPSAFSTLIPDGLQEYEPLRPNDYDAVKLSLGKPTKLTQTNSDSDDTDSSQDELVQDTNDPTRWRKMVGIGGAAGEKPIMNPAVSAMMLRMGYREGDGLGVSNQGRVDPVDAIGNDGRGGLGKSEPHVFFESRSEPRSGSGSVGLVKEKLPVAPQGRRSGSRTSRVLFIRNLPAMSDAALREIIRENAIRFGKVDDVLISNERGEHANGEQCAVAYVAFEENSSSTAALLGLDGMNLRDSELRVTMYPEASFKALSGRRT